MDEIEKEIRKIITELITEKKSELSFDTDLISEFDMDSLQIFRMTEMVEESLGVNLFELEDFIMLFRNYGKLCEAIYKEINK